MSNQREQEIKLQFLEEAKEYLKRIESDLIGFSEKGISPQAFDSLLRAAHSLKGGSGMMGYDHLSHLAHRLEDLFKVLKVGKATTVVNGELEYQLLLAVDSLRKIIAFHRQGQALQEAWLTVNVYPIFDSLHERLGDPQPEDEAALLAAEAGEDLIALLFETEVENALVQLETLLAETTSSNLSDLKEQFVITAQELEGLGQMLQLEALSELCQAVINALESSPLDELEGIARQALQMWRLTQSLVFVGQLNALPTTLTPVEQPNPETALAVVSSRQTTTDLTLAAPETLHVTPIEEERAENTIRVPVRPLEQLSDLFGELTIERNGLDLQLKSLRNLISLLGQRVRTLEQSNFQLRSAYDQIITSEVISTTKNSYPLQETVPTEPSVSPFPTNPLSSYFDLLEMDRYSDLNLLSQEVMETIVQIQEVTNDIEVQLEDTEKVSRELNRTSKQMQTQVTRVRMRPLSDLVGHFPRALRDMSLQHRKPVNLKIRGGSTLIDRSILEALNEPLLHLLRNAFDHGIEDSATRKAQGKPEEGLIEISAAYRGNQTVIILRDDGRGIEIEKIKTRALQMGLNAEEIAAASERDLVDLIFEPGFSTASEVTDLSGRGVGMDVVRTNLQQVRGEIQVYTEPGVGTTFAIAVPFTLSVMRVLLVESEGILLAFPTNAVEEMLLLKPESVIFSAGQEVVELDGYLMPIVRLKDWFKFPMTPPKTNSDTVPKINAPTLLVIEQGDNFIGIQVDCYWGEQEVTIRQVEGTLKMPPGFAGCTILGDGRVVPLVDALSLLNWIERQQDSTQSFSGEFLKREESKLSTPSANISQKNLILVIDDSINVRRFLALTLEKAGYEVEQAKDGQDAIEKLRAGLKVKGVICDIEMPRLDGYGFLVQVKSEPSLKEVPVMMLTSRSGEKHRQAAMNLGARAYFSKPFREQELLGMLKQII